MKWWRLSGLVIVSVSLSACSGFDRYFFTPPPKVPLNLQVVPASKMVINTGGNDVTLVSSKGQQLAITVLTNRTDPPEIKTQRQNDTLTVNVDGSVLLKPKSKVRIEIPSN